MYASFNARAAGLSLPARDAIELAARHGFGGVDLMVRDLMDEGEDPAGLRARMDGSGLRGGAWPLPVHWRGDAETFARDLRRLPALAAAAETLGLTRTGTWVMVETPERPDGEAARKRHLAETAQIHRERLGAIARVLDDHGIRLGLEVIGVRSSATGRGWTFVQRLDDLDQVLGTPWGEVPNLGLLVDGFHLYAADEPPETALIWGVDRVVWVHVADLPASAGADRERIRDELRGLPGDHGAVDAAGLLRLLAENGYAGPVTAEPLARCERLRDRSPEEVALAVSASLASVWPTGASMCCAT